MTAFSLTWLDILAIIGFAGIVGVCLGFALCVCEMHKVLDRTARK